MFNKVLYKELFPNLNFVIWFAGFNVNISDGGVDFGRVNIEVDGKIGTICNKEWSTRDAEVICRYIGFVAGRKWRFVTPIFWDWSTLNNLLKIL